jgi:shikimate kinase
MSERRRNIYLVGFSGSGKSTVGRRLARQLRYAFVDTDEIIERQSGRSIAAIFDEEGEPAFRAWERKVVVSLAPVTTGRTVIALGGGALLDARNRRAVLSSGLVVYLSCSVRELARRLQAQPMRPLLTSQRPSPSSRRDCLMARIKSLLKRREKHYRKAHFRISTAGKVPSEVSRQLVRMIGKSLAKDNR